jgi:hypothetical protein
MNGSQGNVTTPTFNTDIHGTNGWAKFGVPMVAGTRATEIAEFNTAFDNLIGVLKKYGKGGSAQYLSAFNVKAVELHALGELIIDGKVTY